MTDIAIDTAPTPGTATKVVWGNPDNIPSEFKHPLDPLTPDEIAAVCLAVRQHTAKETDIKAIKFITCYLLPPPKKSVLAALGIPLAPGAKPEAAGSIVRRAEVDFLDVVNGHNYNGTLSLKEHTWTVTSLEKLEDGVQPQISVEELLACEQVVRNDKEVQRLAAAVGVKPDEIYCDGWSIGYDERFPQNRRVQQALVFARYGQHENLYAHPMDFVPVIDANTEQVLHIDFPPVWQSTPNGPKLSVDLTAPPPGLLPPEDSFASANRDRIPPPGKKFNFLPDLIKEEEPDFKLRDDVKPLHVVQPEGVSFKMSGNQLEWQKWKMHISFNHREGLVLSTITYNDGGEVRPIFYRLSLAEMVVPYGAPEYPHPRKFAFDSGEYGMGTMANELSLGCDCLGQIHYLPGSFVGHNGEAIIIKNVICIHEEDAGVLWKHTDYRTNGRSQTVRRRRLVVSMVCTLANYEYIWNYHFYQDGTIEMEVRLSGILQVYVSQDGEPTPYGSIVAPNINAHYHQHMFCVRVDPMVDGLNNSVIESDILPSDEPTGSSGNFAGNAFVSVDSLLKKATGRPYDFAKERRWRIVNPARKHYASGKEVGYALGLKGGVTPTMAKPDGWALRRAKFLENAVWVCPDVEGEKGSRMWPSGKYVPQTRTEPVDSVGAWVKEEGKVDDEDILVYIVIGTTHIPRPEDWPVMPVETLHLTFKPNNFFKYNPSMDVPGSKDPLSKPAFTNGTSAGSSNCCN